ncbi:MAG TPA: dipicolinic acid synthetase subunit A, partial [Firmicutes bacterium]|nr:dipicolinic acid synthetase subunit A [Bacillota bacterium]
NPPKLDGAFFKSLPAKTPVFIGWASKELKELFGGARLIEVANDDELAVLNSIPTAEGAIA